MQTKGWMMMRVLLNRFHQGTGIEKLLTQHASKEIGKNILEQKIASSDFSEALMLPEDLLKRIHYSWLQPLFKKVPPELETYYLSALPETHFSGLCKLLEKQTKRLSLVPELRTFFISNLFKHLEISHLLPPSFLPPSPLDPLVHFNKQSMMELIDFLGLHDFAEETKYILDKNQLKILFNLLTPKKQHYVKICMAKKERFPVARLNLEQWKGTRQQLEVILHKRGLERLAKALAGQHPDLIWYVVHLLDTGRGTVLSKTIPEKEEPGVTPYLVQQLISLINFLKEDPKVE